LFTRIVGLSPRSYCHSRRLTRLKALLRSEKSVSDAAYAAGYGSIRALYEKSSRELGMSPGAYRRGGDGMAVRYVLLDTRVGRLLVARTNLGVCTILSGGPDAELVEELSGELPAATLMRGGPPTATLRRAIRSCEVEKPLLLTLSDVLRRELFQAKVAKALSGEHVVGRRRAVVP
jgi:AraC family transcriptional regulator, regulatory protein of adaptative response / methylated-DNA-[protein]-cysteine methyltransferase